MGQAVTSSCACTAHDAHDEATEAREALVEPSQALARGLSRKHNSADLEAGASASAGALNEILTHIWPCISALTTKAIVESLEPAVRDVLGSLGSSFSFDRQHCSLGDRPIHFGNVLVNKTVQHSHDGDLTNLVLEAEVDWSGQSGIHASLGGASFGIQRLRVLGVLVFELVGMLDRAPLFQGYRIYFLDSPTLDMELTGVLRALQPAVVRRKLLEVLSRQLSQALVVPNMFGMTLEDEVDIFRVTHPRPRGILEFTVWGAQDLQAPAHGAHKGAGACDVCATVSCGADSFASKAAKSKEPQWSHTVCFPIMSVHHQRIKVVVADASASADGSCVGSAELPVSSAVGWGTDRQQLNLRSHAREPGYAGSVQVSAVWRNLFLKPLGEKQGAGLIFAGVYSASHVRQGTAGSALWVVVECSHVSSSSRTQSPQASARVVPPEDPRNQDVLKHKLQLCRKYHMSIKDISDLLQVDAAKLEASDALRDISEMDEIQFDHASDFLVEDVQRTVVTFRLMSAQPGEVELGRHVCSISSFLSGDDDATFTGDVQLGGTSACLKVRLQCRLLGEPSSSLHWEHSAVKLTGF